MSLDLLSQRRSRLGVPLDRPLPLRRWLLQGGLLGGGLVLISLVAGLLLLARRQQLAEAVLLLEPQAQASLAVRAEADQLRGSARRQEAANRKLSTALVGVPSSSALLTALAAVVPAGVQLTTASTSPTALLLEGISRDPNGFIRLNGLQLGLQASPLFVASDVVLQQARRKDRSAEINFRLNSPFRSSQPLLSTAQLRQLGAEGMVHRREVLQRLGLLK
jgi:Tfp pilus assembly protein PilN